MPIEFPNLTTTLKVVKMASQARISYMHPAVSQVCGYSATEISNDKQICQNLQVVQTVRSDWLHL
jgi:hypothetical protein